jgi:2-polyprenyl-6-methoxyphenol hydroxylase-like FAD-dependent oxidoreductase
MAMGGAYVLAEELGRGADVASALERYQQRLQPAIRKKQKAGRSIARWFVPEGRVTLALRDAALRMSASRIGGWVLRRQISAESVLSKKK